MESNYEKQAVMARDIFMRYDQQKMIDKFQLEHDETYLYLRLLDETYRISRMTGEVETIEKDGNYLPCREYDVVMVLYDILCYSDQKPTLAGEWCQLHSLQVTMSSPETNKFTQNCANAFSGKTDQLWQICRRIGGKETDISAGADVYWQFDVFSFFPVQLRYWDQDEDFPAQIQLLWDRNSLNFMHFETLYYVVAHLMRKLLHQMDL